MRRYLIHTIILLACAIYIAIRWVLPIYKNKHNNELEIIVKKAKENGYNVQLLDREIPNRDTTPVADPNLFGYANLPDDIDSIIKILEDSTTNNNKKDTVIIL